MQHKLPSIVEIRLEMINLNYHFDEVINESNIQYNVSATPFYEPDDKIIFFIHVRIILIDSEKKKHSIFHTDYLSIIEFKDSWESQETIKIEVDLLAHLLGMSFLMIRGAIRQRLANSILVNYPIPVINPTKLLKNKLEETDNHFILKQKKDNRNC